MMSFSDILLIPQKRVLSSIGIEYLLWVKQKWLQEKVDLDRELNEKGDKTEKP